MGDLVDFESYTTLKFLSDTTKKKRFVTPDQETADNFDKVMAHLLKSHIFDLSMLCKSKGWHMTGLCLSVGSEHIETMLERGILEQSIKDLKDNLQEQRSTE